MGLVPVFIYTDEVWVPYIDLCHEKIGWTCCADNLGPFMAELVNLSDAEIERREEFIVSLRDSHFSVACTLSHMEKFMSRSTKKIGTAAAGDYKCQVLPEMVRDGDV
jgi:hypothetical protein